MSQATSIQNFDLKRSNFIWIFNNVDIFKCDLTKYLETKYEENV
jgi:hypothetical protein